MLNKLFAKRHDLPNRHYYDAIDAAMAKLPAPTIADALEQMSSQGNEAYHLAFGTANDTPFQEKLDQRHEIAHIAARAGHTMQQENFQHMFQLGLTHGVGLSDYTNIAAPDLVSEVYAHEHYHSKIAASWNDKRCSPPSEVNRAVNLAAGMYLRGKIDSFLEQGLLEKPYTIQKRELDNLTDRDQPFRIMLHDKHDWLDIGSAPYALIKLSKQEWAAIEAVATGIASPEQTKYPERMKAVQKALVATGMAYDIKPNIERITKNHAANHPKGEAFDPEKFKAAREKRDAEERTWRR